MPTDTVAQRNDEGGARYSIDAGNDVLVWDAYDSLEAHRASGATGEKLREDFGDLRDFEVREFAEVD